MPKLTIVANIHARPEHKDTVREHWQTHMQAPHLAAYIKATEGLVDKFTVSKMTPIG